VRYRQNIEITCDFCAASAPAVVIILRNYDGNAYVDEIVAPPNWHENHGRGDRWQGWNCGSCVIEPLESK